MNYLVHPLPYEPDSLNLFERIRHLAWPMLLDSGQPSSRYGRFDIVVAEPFVRIETQGEDTVVIAEGESQTLQHQNPFTLLNQYLQRYRVVIPETNACSEWPFVGGALGYWAYDLGRNLEALPVIAQDAEQMPSMRVGVYDWAIITDHEKHQRCLVSTCQHASTQQFWPDLIALLEANSAPNAVKPFEVEGEVSSNLTPQAYKAAFDKVKRYIFEGDCYQVNLAQRFAIRAQGDSFSAFKKIRGLSPAPYMAYLQFPDTQILSASPERFLQADAAGHVETKPIKGTRRRLTDPIADATMTQDLANSLKDRAENLMIVDLLRNDISKVCQVGTVNAPRLFEIESFSNVHHLVSTITGQLAPSYTAVDLLQACFPGGSITGAPKLRSMEIIEELEPHRRGIYCGAIGYISFHGKMDTNIAIRTAVYSNNELRFWAGGGVVADSECDKEYQETWDKASAWLALSAQMRE